jgi:hypothetical protein
MSSNRRSRPRLYFLLVVLCLGPGIAFIASLPWLSQQPEETVFLMSGITATVSVVASLLLAVLHEGRMDEWERSNARFSSHWGEAVGTSVLALLLSVPWFRDFVVSTMGNLVGTEAPDPKLVIMTFVAGFVATVLARAICMIALSIGWALWKSRPAREAV